MTWFFYSFLGSAEQIIHDLSAPAKRKCDFRFAHKINSLQLSILTTHPCVAGSTEQVIHAACKRWQSFLHYQGLPG